MKSRSLFLFIIGCIFSCTLVAQEKENVVFRYSCTPTSTNSYSIEITRDQFTLRTINKTPGKNDRIKRTDSTKYSYAFNYRQKQSVDSIISVNRLDSAGLYEKRQMEWGTVWEIEIQENSTIRNISLPNYNNAGLKALIHFIVCIIPDKERPPFECEKCK
ncbi:hypothetical protein [Ferruginibacter sp.]